MADTIDLDDDMVAFRAGTVTFRTSLIAWMRWRASYRESEGGSPYAYLEAAREKLRAECGVSLSDGHVDSFLHEVTKAYGSLKKKQHDELICATSLDSTASP